MWISGETPGLLLLGRSRYRSLTQDGREVGLPVASLDYVSLVPAVSEPLGSERTNLFMFVI